MGQLYQALASSMKIGFISYQPPDHMTGGYLYNSELIKNLALLKHQCLPIVLDPRQPSAILENTSWQDFDFIIQDELCFPHLLKVNHVFRDKGLPVIALVHVLNQFLHRKSLLRSWRRYQEILYLKSAAALIFVSEANYTDTRSLIALPQPTVIAEPGNDHVAPPAVDTAAKLSHSGPLRLLAVGNIAPHKGFIELIEVLEPASFPWKLTIAGNPGHSSYAKRLLKCLRRYRLNSRVNITGALTRTELNQAYASHDIFMLSSHYESFAIAATEAMAWGLPVLGWSAGGPRAYITNQKNGFLVSYPERQNLLPYLTKLFFDRGKLLELSQGAKKQSLGFSTWMANGKTVATFLASLKGR